MTQWEEDPPVIFDFSVTPVCDKQECFLQSKSSTLNLIAGLGKLVKRVKEKMGEDVETGRSFFRRNATKLSAFNVVRLQIPMSCTNAPDAKGYIIMTRNVSGNPGRNKKRTVIHLTTILDGEGCLAV
jgi:hypothetical protein